MQRPAEEVRADRDLVVPQRERYCVAVGETAERGLRDECVRRDDDAERQREPVHEHWPKGQPPLAKRVDEHANERDREQDLLPRRDRRQRRAAHARRVERRHRSVVQREADDEQVQGDDRAAPDGGRGDGQEQRVDDELDGGHRGNRTTEVLAARPVPRGARRRTKRGRRAPPRSAAAESRTCVSPFVDAG